MEIRNSGDKEKAIDIVETLLLKEGIPVNCIQTDRDDNYIYAEYELSLNEEKAKMSLYYNPDTNYWQIRAQIAFCVDQWDIPENALITAITAEAPTEIIEGEEGRAFLIKEDGMHGTEYIAIDRLFYKVKSSAEFVAAQIANHNKNRVIDNNIDA